MATITQNITIDVARANVFDAVIGKQYDEDSRFLKCSITQEGEPLTIPSGSSIAINAKRPDGTMGSFAGTRSADGTAIVPISSWILEQNGMVNLSVTIVGSNGDKLTSCTFYLNVQEAESEGFILVYTAPSALTAGNYYITLSGTNYQFTLTEALATGDRIYFSSVYDEGKTVDTSDGSTIETFTITEGTTGTQLTGSDVINFLASFMANIADLGNKADKVGESPDLVAGTAAQIIGEEFTENKVPYSFRQTPGSGKRLAEEVVGATVGWNQLVTQDTFGPTATISDVTFTNNGDGSITTNGTATATIARQLVGAMSVVSGHKYFLSGCPSGGSSSSYSLVTSGYSDTGNGTIIPNTSSIRYVWISIANGTNVDNLVFWPNIIDLTAALGSTIADYLATLESNTPGAGVAKFRELFPKDYYAYCEPSLQSVRVSEHREYGVNAWDEVWEVGSIDNSTGQNTASTSIIRSTNYIPVLGGQTYYFKSPATITAFFYDEGKNFLSLSYESNTTETIPESAKYMRFKIATTYGVVYKNDITINISNPLINGHYYPYSVNAYPLEAVELRGVLRLDGNNEIYADGDTYEGDGTVTRRYGIVDLGTLSWDISTTPIIRFFATVPNMAFPGTRLTPMVCANYVAICDGQPFDSSWDKVIYAAGGSVYVHDSAYTDENAFRAAMSGVYLVYELATPTTESATPYPSLQHCSGGGTEEYVDYLVAQGTRDVSIPAGHNSKYYPDLTQRISDIPEPPSGDGTYTLQCTVSSGVRTFAWV